MKRIIPGFLKCLYASALLLLPTMSLTSASCHAAPTSFHKINVADLKDGDRVIFVTASSKITTGCYSFSYKFHGKGVKTETLKPVDDSITLDDSNFTAVFTVKEGDTESQSKRFFALFTDKSLIGRQDIEAGGTTYDPSPGGWLSANETRGLYLNDKEEESLTSDDYALIGYNENQQAHYIRLHNNTSMNLNFIRGNLDDNDIQTGKMTTSQNVSSWFDIYRADEASSTDYTITFAIDGEEVTAETDLSNVSTGSELSIACASAEAMLRYESSYLPDHGELMYDGPITIVSGRTTITAIAYVDDVEVQRAVITVRTPDVDPVLSGIDMSVNPFGLDSDTENGDYQSGNFSTEADGVVFSLDADQQVRLVGDGESATLDIAPDSQLDIEVTHDKTRLTSVTVITEGEATIGIYKQASFGRANHDRARTSQRVSANLEKIDEISGSGQLEWDYTGDADLTGVTLRNESDAPLMVKSIEARTAQYTMTDVDGLYSDTPEYEYYTLDGRHVAAPQVRGLYIRRNLSDGTSVKTAVF